MYFHVCIFPCGLYLTKDFKSGNFNQAYQFINYSACLEAVSYDPSLRIITYYAL